MQEEGKDKCREGNMQKTCVHSKGFFSYALPPPLTCHPAPFTKLRLGGGRVPGWADRECLASDISSHCICHVAPDKSGEGCICTKLD